jgi:hypothetical protein
MDVIDFSHTRYGARRWALLYSSGSLNENKKGGITNAKPLLNHLALDNPYNKSTALDGREFEQVFCKRVDRGLRSQTPKGGRIIHKSCDTSKVLSGRFLLLTIMQGLADHSFPNAGALYSSDVSRRNGQHRGWVGSTGLGRTRPNVSDDH